MSALRSEEEAMIEETKEMNPVDRAKEYCRGMIADLL